MIHVLFFKFLGLSIVCTVKTCVIGGIVLLSLHVGYNLKKKSYTLGWGWGQTKPKHWGVSGMLFLFTCYLMI